MGMQTEKLYYRGVGVCIIICHLFAGMQFWLTRAELDSPIRWIPQFYILLTLSSVCSFLLFIFRTQPVGSVYFAVKVIIFILIGYGEGPYLGVEFTLLMLLMLEISAYFTLLPSLILTSVILAATLLNQQPIRAWNTTLPGGSLHDLASLGIYACMLAVCANALRHVVKKLDAQIQIKDRLDKVVSQLIDANLGFQRYAVAASETSAVQERKRISRDIHDTAVHTLVNIIMLSESAIDCVTREQTKLPGILQQIITQAKESVRDTRQALRELRSLEEPPLNGLKAIQHLVKVFADATGVQVHIDYGNFPWEINSDIEQVLYRMIQEGLTNAFRHGKATQINIRLWIFETHRKSEVIVRIHDNGQGAADIKKGIGLQGMEERIQKLHGRLEAKNVAGGFEVTAWIPLERQM